MKLFSGQYSGIVNGQYICESQLNIPNLEEAERLLIAYKHILSDEEYFTKILTLAQSAYKNNYFADFYSLLIVKKFLAKLPMDWSCNYKEFKFIKYNNNKFKNYFFVIINPEFLQRRLHSLFFPIEWIEGFWCFNSEEDNMEIDVEWLKEGETVPKNAHLIRNQNYLLFFRMDDIFMFSIRKTIKGKYESYTPILNVVDKFEVLGGLKSFRKWFVPSNKEGIPEDICLDEGFIVEGKSSELPVYQLGYGKFKVSI